MRLLGQLSVPALGCSAQAQREWLTPRVLRHSSPLHLVDEPLQPLERRIRAVSLSIELSDLVE
ncbi:hypothetical protein PF010_g20183 [Phytophthora fragariae]|uniref:Uncharacterized protein n=1 Tax=Phytophthora fragariae TaxID=53985 RepID=A0A6A3PEA8_9STRA|nr:hypothetical protein PF007_g31233 [Phytophthora fragariae]KAE9086192.1 hypothetical protein PF010_g20183 [Phytophthora fragariae]KAE9272052.1 hypothetical protein PF001_g28109 [Phytophthora fragariae]